MGSVARQRRDDAAPTAPFLGIASSARGLMWRERLHGDKTFYTHTLHINYSNACVLSCALCAFYRPLDHPQAYTFSLEEIARKLSDAGFSVVSGGGPGLMEAANKGAYAGKSPSVGLNIRLPLEQNPNPFVGNAERLIHYKYFFTRKLFLVKEK